MVQVAAGPGATGEKVSTGGGEPLPFFFSFLELIACAVGLELLLN